VQPPRDRRTDPLGGTGDEYGFIVQLRRHDLKILPDSRTMYGTNKGLFLLVPRGDFLSGHKFPKSEEPLVRRLI
jgi:hypothetical protein